MNPIFSAIGEHILLTVEDQLTNNEVSDDDEMHEHFIEIGLTEAQADAALQLRPLYRLNLYMIGQSPLFQGDTTTSFDPHTRSFKRTQ
ncbi:hypothetical protein PSH66_04430 [Pseudomonas sp. FP597]|uniref:hypothetical protein n=1 Tax=Pseudomonas sp. FP597 TaxID=2954096 RepID=UPI002733C58E|nr:hypothetical protein [Pseudomonas sp. FP597]WLI07583.1 hypothetical protein PSH66_04430 [Pseudomonas sp. FP597]